jgi:hypothetical protein
VPADQHDAHPAARLNEAERDETVITVAWVDVPSLQVHRERQRYSSARSVAGDPVVVFETYSRHFRAELTVDDAGLVVDYPEIAARLAS